MHPLRIPPKSEKAQNAQIETEKSVKGRTSVSRLAAPTLKKSLLWLLWRVQEPLCARRELLEDLSQDFIKELVHTSAPCDVASNEKEAQKIGKGRRELKSSNFSSPVIVFV